LINEKFNNLILFNFFFENSSFVFRDKSFFQPSPGMVNWFLFFCVGFFLFCFGEDFFQLFFWFGVRTRKSEAIAKIYTFCWSSQKYVCVALGR